MQNNYKLLIRKDIIAILDGDIRLDNIPGSIMGMPYLSGCALCEMSDIFGLHQEYGKSSRWVYLENLLNYVIEKNRCDELLKYMFDLERFYQLEILTNKDDVEKYYREICKGVIDLINAKLALGRHELKCVEEHFYIVDTNQKINIEASKIIKIDIPYVRKLPERCEEELLMGNYDSVITKTRTLIEEVLLYIIEKNKEPILGQGDIGKLYNQVKKIYNMHQNKDYDGRINALLYGLERIVESIGDMRNVNSDAHGVGSRRINIQEREARLAINSAMTFCEYMLSIVEDASERK